MCNQSIPKCCAAWFTEMLGQSRQTFGATAPDERESVRLPGPHGETPEAYVYSNIRFNMLRLCWHSHFMATTKRHISTVPICLQRPLVVQCFATSLHTQCQQLSKTARKQPLLMLWYFRQSCRCGSPMCSLCWKH